MADAKTESMPRPNSTLKHPLRPRQKRGEEKEEDRIEIDLDGIQDRIVAFPVDDGVYEQFGALRERCFSPGGRSRAA